MKLVLDLEKSIPPEGYEFDGAEARYIKSGERYANSNPANPIAHLWGGPTRTNGKYFTLKRAKWKPKWGDEVWGIVFSEVSCLISVIAYSCDSLLPKYTLIRGPFKTEEAALAALDQLNNAPTGE